jgi:hypothetical protein
MTVRVAVAEDVSMPPLAVPPSSWTLNVKVENVVPKELLGSGRNLRLNEVRSLA